MCSILYKSAKLFIDNKCASHALHMVLSRCVCNYSHITYIEYLHLVTLRSLHATINGDQEVSGSGRDHPAPPHSVKLPEFWPENSAAWLALAESRFRMHDIYNEWTSYDQMVSSLAKDSLRLMLDFVTSPPEDDPYTTLKERLLDSHTLTNYQRIEQLLAMDGLGSKKPSSELLAHMLELCPAGEETSKFFVFHFLHHLPQELSIMLSYDDHQ